VKEKRNRVPKNVQLQLQNQGQTKGLMMIIQILMNQYPIPIEEMIHTKMTLDLLSQMRMIPMKITAVQRKNVKEKNELLKAVEREICLLMVTCQEYENTVSRRTKKRI
jgi:hypothetical protein